MNHLRDLLDQPPGSLGYDPEIPKHVALKTIQRSRVLGQQALCFFMGDIAGVIALKAVPDLLVKIPYPVTWFESSDSTLPGVANGILAQQRDDGLLDMACFGRVGRQWALLWTATEFDLATGLGKTHSLEPDFISGVQTGGYAIRAFCSAMSCVNVQRQVHEPDVKLQKARAKRGKAPFFSFWTLQINGRSERGEVLGGTHASPRVHLRRGHPRQYAPGKWTWVQAHAVGNPSLGLVHKDYASGLV